MYTLIPEQSAQYLKKEYRIRVFILTFLFLSLGVWIGIVGLFPSYIVSTTQEKKVLAETHTLQQSSQSTSTAIAIAQIVAVNDAINTLKDHQDTLMLSTLVEDITNHRIPGITITGFQISRSGTSGSIIVISGIASTRNVLGSFVNNLSGDARFSKVYLPVSYLASDTNINFNINLTGIE